jgi:hypothetical protein
VGKSATPEYEITLRKSTYRVLCTKAAHTCACVEVVMWWSKKKAEPAAQGNLLEGMKRELAYEKGTDLFGPKVTKAQDSGAKLLEWYRGRLRSIFGHVSTARLIKNTRGNPLYYLIWAGPHKKGLEGAEYILSKGERLQR